MKARKIALFLVLLLVLFAAPASASVAVFTVGSNIYLLDGQQFSMDAAPYQDGRVFVPLRYAALAAGVDPANVFYDGRTVTLVKGNTIVRVTIGDRTMIKNGSAIVMDAVPVVVGGRTMLPVRWVAQALDARVDWNGYQVTVTAQDQDNNQKDNNQNQSQIPVQITQITPLPVQPLPFPRGIGIVAGSETEPGCREVKILWEAVPGATGYRVYFRMWVPENNTWGGTWRYDTASTSWAEDLVMGRTYNVQVTAVNQAGESSPFDFGSFTVNKEGASIVDLPGQNPGPCSGST